MVFPMAPKLHMLINIVLFQIGWLSCVLGASEGKPFLGPICVLIIVLLHLALAQSRINELKMITQVTVIGAMWESLMITTGLLTYLNGMIFEYFPPYWIIAMWFLFATTLNVSLRWLHHRMGLASVMGLIFGPTTYYAGAKLGGVSFTDPTVSIIVVAISWAILLPIIVFFARRLDTF